MLIENGSAPGYLSGYTDNYIRVEFIGDSQMINQIQNMRLGASCQEGTVTATVVKNILA